MFISPNSRLAESFGQLFTMQQYFPWFSHTLLRWDYLVWRNFHLLQAWLCLFLSLHFSSMTIVENAFYQFSMVIPRRYNFQFWLAPGPVVVIYMLAILKLPFFGYLIFYPKKFKTQQDQLLKFCSDSGKNLLSLWTNRKYSLFLKIWAFQKRVYLQCLRVMASWRRLQSSLETESCTVLLTLVDLDCTCVRYIMLLINFDLFTYADSDKKRSWRPTKCSNGWVLWKIGDCL